MVYGIREGEEVQDSSCLLRVGTIKRKEGKRTHKFLLPNRNPNQSHQLEIFS